MVLYNSPQNINIFFMLLSLYIFFVGIYQLVITSRLLDNNGDASNLDNIAIGVPISLNIFGLLIFLILFIICLVKMLCGKAKYREYVFTLVYCILVISYLCSSAIPVDIVIINKTGLSVSYVEFCYVNTVALIIVSAFATILYICSICKNDKLDNVARRLDLYQNDAMFKQTVADQVGKNPDTTFGLSNVSQLQEICSTPFLPGTTRANIADNDFTKDACGAALGLSPDSSL